MFSLRVTALLACLASAPAAAATFTYTGAPLAVTGTTGFKRITLQFAVPGAVQPNTTYTMSSLRVFSDGVNKLPAITGYLAKGRAYGGALDAFLWGTLTTDASGQAASWTFKIEISFTDGLGSEGYDLLVNGPGNESTCPIASCGYDSLLTTLPETLPSTLSLTSAKFGTLTHN